VFDGGGRQFHLFDRDGVPDGGEHRCDVSVDAVTKQLHQLRVAAQLGNLRDQHLLHRAGQLGHSLISLPTMAAADRAMTAASSWPAFAMTRP